MVYGRQGLGFGGWWAVGGDRRVVHRQPAAATAAGRATARLALAGAGKGMAGKERGYTRISESTDPLISRRSSTGQQRADRRSPGCAVRGTAIAGQLCRGYMPAGSECVSPQGAGSWTGRSP
jgi:hypothetical protein